MRNENEMGGICNHPVSINFCVGDSAIHAETARVMMGVIAYEWKGTQLEAESAWRWFLTRCRCWWHRTRPLQCALKCVAKENSASFKIDGAWNASGGCLIVTLLCICERGHRHVIGRWWWNRLKRNEALRKICASNPDGKGDTAGCTCRDPRDSDTFGADLCKPSAGKCSFDI